MSGLQNIIDSHTVLDLDIQTEASRLVIPQHGYFTMNCPVIVANLGSINIRSIVKGSDQQAKLTEMVSTGKTQEEIMDAMRSSSYEQFNILLTDMQVCSSFTIYLCRPCRVLYMHRKLFV